MISIIVPVRGASSTVGDCLASLCAQTYRNIEILVVWLDGDDNSLGILEKLHDSRIRIIEQIDRTGPGGARNLGMAHAGGEWLGFAEADDVVEECFFEKLMEHADESTDIAWGGIIEHGRKWVKHPCTIRLSGFNEKFSRIKNGATFDKIFRADLIRKHHVRFAEGIRWEDNIFLFQAFYCARSIITVPDIYYTYRPLVWSREYRLSLQRDVFPAAEGIVSWAKKLDITRRQRNLIYRKIIKSFARSFLDDTEIYRQMVHLMGHHWFLVKTFLQCKWRRLFHKYSAFHDDIFSKEFHGMEIASELRKLTSAVCYTNKLQSRIERQFEKAYCSRGRAVLSLVFFCIKSLLKTSLGKSSVYVDARCHVLLRLCGGAGDHAHSLKFCHCLLEKFKAEICIDILLERRDNYLKESLYESVDFIDKIYVESAPKHDVEIALVRFPRIEFVDSKRISLACSPNFAEYLRKITDFEIKNNQLYSSDFLGRCYSLVHKRRRENQPDVYGLLNMANNKKFHLSIGDKFISSTLQKYGLERGKYIILQTGSGVHFQRVKNEARQWPIAHYSQLVLSLKEQYPDKKMIQCGVVGQTPIQNIDVNLLGKTTFSEFLVLLKEAFLLVSQEGGSSILRHYLSRGRSCVLFGPTDPRFFGFKENLNLCADVCPGCEWLDRDWYKRCMISKGKALCMSALKVEYVASMIESSCG